MLKKKILLPIAFGLILTLTACSTDNGDIDPNTQTPPPVEDQAPEPTPDEEIPGENIEDEVTP